MRGCLWQQEDMDALDFDASRDDHILHADESEKTGGEMAAGTAMEENGKGSTWGKGYLPQTAGAVADPKWQASAT